LNGVLGIGRITQKAVGSSVERWQASAENILKFVPRASALAWSGAIAAPKLCIYICHLADAVCSCNIHDDHLCIASAQPLNEELVQPVGRVQWNPVAGISNLLVAPPCFHELSRHLHAFTVEVVIV